MKTSKAIEILDNNLVIPAGISNEEQEQAYLVRKSIDEVINAYKHKSYMLDSYKLALAPACLFIGVVVGMLIVILMK